MPLVSSNDLCPYNDVTFYDLSSVIKILDAINSWETSKKVVSFGVAHGKRLYTPPQSNFFQNQPIDNLKYW